MPGCPPAGASRDGGPTVSAGLRWQARGVLSAAVRVSSSSGEFDLPEVTWFPEQRREVGVVLATGIERIVDTRNAPRIHYRRRLAGTLSRLGSDCITINSHSVMR
jgi:hypothetical protein